jgi:hypothetical protein
VHVRPLSRRARHLAATVAVAVAGALLLTAQPLESPWWTGHDFDTVYAASAVSLFRGDRSTFFDHPGVPLQESLAAALTADWVARDVGTNRTERAETFLRNLDRLRPHLRILGSLLFVGSALIAYAAVAWATGSAFGGLFAALTLLAAPDVTVWAAVVKPDPLLAALSVASVALLAVAARTRSAFVYIGASALIGYAVTVKVHALGLLAPLAVAVLVWPPERLALAEGWRSWRQRRHPVVVAVVLAWLVAALFLNALAAPPALRPLGLLAVAVAAAASLTAGAWMALRRTRARRWVELGAVLAAAGLAGAVVPNLLYANVPAPTLRWLGVTLSGRGVEASTTFVPPWNVLAPWLGVGILALVGLALALARGDRTALLWALAAAAMGGLALLRYGSVPYYTAAIALLAPLGVEALKAISRGPIIAAFVVFGVLYPPLQLQVDEARDRGDIASATQRVNEWVEPRLRARDVALTFLESDDSRTCALVRHYADVPPRRYRFLPATSEGVAHAAASGLDVRYVITAAPADPRTLLASLGLTGSATALDAPGNVYRVSR